jgi:hypothetical protein
MQRWFGKGFRSVFFLLFTIYTAPLAASNLHLYNATRLCLFVCL